MYEPIWFILPDPGTAGVSVRAVLAAQSTPQSERTGGDYQQKSKIIIRFIVSTVDLTRIFSD